jgi:hypothetical protein
MGGTVIPLPNTPLWRDAQLKHKDKFTLPLPISKNCVRERNKKIT